MSNAGTDGLRAALPPHHPKSRHQLTRSISELSSPIRLHRHSSNRRARDKEKDRDDRITAPPITEKGRASLDGGTRSAAVTPNLSPNPSRRTSVLLSASEDMAPVLPLASSLAAKMPAPAPAPAPAVAREDELLRAQQSAEARESGLQRALVDVATTADATTRRLDNAYYSVLERVGALRGTLVALRELAGLSHALNGSFSSEAGELTSDVAAQLDAFGAFGDQQGRVEALQGRVREGRVRVGALSERLDTVRKRIEGWERADRHWQERTRRRLMAVWLVTSVAAFLLLLLFVGAQYAPVELGGLEDKAVGFANQRLSALRNMTHSAGRAAEEPAPWDPADASRVRADGSGSQNWNKTLGERRVPPEAVDEVLREFDEL